MPEARIHHRASCLNPASRLLEIQLLLQGDFNSTFEIEMPRWVPGSYMIREPLKHVRDISVNHGAKISRHGECGYRIKPPKGGCKDILVQYQILCPDLTVRTNHMDASHLHLVPTFTWMMPSKGWQGDKQCTVTLDMPAHWTAATQLNCHPGKAPKHEAWGNGNEKTWQPPNEDELYDGIIEANANSDDSRMMSGAMHHLRVWDAGSYEIPKESITKIQDCMEALVKEFVALFGPLPFKEYWTILHLTGGARGGLEHLRSQTSMVPRTAILEEHDDAWRDLVSLLSHEYLHLWNIKRLRPTEYLEYELSKESRSSLLWWFEGGTSWLGDIICLKSGVWSEEDWRKDMNRKMKRFLSGSGNLHQSLATSSYEAWIHLYRPHAYSRESTISYYLEGEMVMVCIDAEMRRRNKGEYGLEQLFPLLWKRHGLDSPEVQRLGLKYGDIRKGLVSLKGGARLGSMLDQLVIEKIRPNIEEAMATLGLKFSEEEEEKKNRAWLGLQLAGENGLYVRSFLPESPLRDVLLPDDEILAINGLRVRSKNQLDSLLKGLEGKSISLTISRHGALTCFEIEGVSKPVFASKLNGVGNKLWKSLVESAQDS